MSVIIILLTVSISVAAAFLLAFLWSVKRGQYDDEKGPAIRMLFDNTAINKDALSEPENKLH